MTSMTEVSSRRRVDCRCGMVPAVTERQGVSPSGPCGRSGAVTVQSARAGRCRPPRRHHAGGEPPRRPDSAAPPPARILPFRARSSWAWTRTARLMPPLWSPRWGRSWARSPFGHGGRLPSAARLGPQAGLRRSVRSQSHRVLLGPSDLAPAQPRRRPPGQRRPAPHRVHPAARRPPHPGVLRTPHSEGQDLP